MRCARHSTGWVLVAASLMVGVSATSHLRAQDAPARREVTVVIRGGKFTPNRIEVAQDDLVTLIVRSEDAAHSFAVDEYRIARRVPAGGSTSFEFRADKPGTFPFYCNLTSEPGHRAERGELIVLAK